MNATITGGQNKPTFKNCFLMMIMFFMSADSIIVGTNSNELANLISKYIPFVIVSILVCYIIFHKIKFQFLSLIVSFAFTLGILLTLSFAQGENSLSNSMFHIAILLCGFILSTIIPFDSFFKVFEKTMFFLAVFSLIVFAIASISPSIIKLFPTFINTANDIYYFIGFSVVKSYGLVDTFFLRNFGIFREPGVFQLYINIALCFYLFSGENKKSYVHIAIYMITIITTTSTSGIFAMLILLLAFIMQRNSQNNQVKRLIVVLIVAVLVFIFSGISDKLMYSMLKISDMSNASTLSRVGSLYANFDMLYSHPFIGIGQAKQMEEFPTLVAKYTGAYSVDNTNTILYVFSCYGFSLGILFLIGCIRFARKFCYTKLGWIIITAFILMLLSSENIIYSYSAYILMMYGYKRENFGEIKEVYLNDNSSY